MNFDTLKDTNVARDLKRREMNMKRPWISNKSRFHIFRKYNLAAPAIVLGAAAFLMSQAGWLGLTSAAHAQGQENASPAQAARGATAQVTGDEDQGSVHSGW